MIKIRENKCVQVAVLAYNFVQCLGEEEHKNPSDRFDRDYTLHMTLCYCPIKSEKETNKVTRLLPWPRYLLNSGATGP